jgi:hypothetical protein
LVHTEIDRSQWRKAVNQEASVSKGKGVRYPFEVIALHLLRKKRANKKEHQGEVTSGHLCETCSHWIRLQAWWKESQTVCQQLPESVTRTRVPHLQKKKNTVKSSQ